MQKLLVPVDLSPFSEKAVQYAAELARMAGGSLTLLTVINDVLPYYEFFPMEHPPADYFDAMKERARNEMRSLAERHAENVPCDLMVKRGQPAAGIVETASSGNYDLIVMATHGHSGLEHALLGSITEKVLRKAHCPVLVVR
jgi:nucleotide-binding universal stress UspA family protein